MEKWAIKGYLNGEWILWNYFNGTYADAKYKASELLLRLKYSGVLIEEK